VLPMTLSNLKTLVIYTMSIGRFSVPRLQDVLFAFFRLRHID
jgi:hypothetical protein